MNKWKRVLGKLLFPKTVWVFLLVNISAFLLVYAFCSGQCPDIVAYGSYALSAYALVTVCVRVPRIIKKIKSGLYSYQVCGWLMLVLNSAISVIAIMVVFEDQTIVYPGFMIYAMAAFAFYCLTMGIVNMVKYWHRNNPIFSAVKRIGMAKALVSIFTLQVAMLTQFGSGDYLMNRLFNAITGFAVCTIITVMAILMLVGVKKDYKELKVNIS